MSQIHTNTAVLSSVTTSTPFQIFPPAGQGLFGPGYMLPFIGVNLSSGAVLTYNVEVTGDDVANVGYVAANGNWFGFTNLTGLSASAVGTLGAAVRAVRLNVTAYTSGTATIQMCQVIT
jgi:hypothetical protein